MKFKSLILGDIRQQYKYGFYALYTLFTLVYITVLRILLSFPDLARRFFFL